MNVWVLLLPERTGIFTSLDHLTSVIKSGEVEDMFYVDNEIIARKIIRRHYSVECLFLMGIDDTGMMHKNKMYLLPRNCIGKIVETEVKKMEEE